MSRSSPANTPPTTLQDYAHSPIHYAVVLGDHSSLTRLVSSLPKLTDPDQIHSEFESISQERVAEQISTVLDCRDVPFRETPLHLAVRIGDVFAVKTIASAGANITLQNDAGWNPLHEALCRRNSEITEIIIRQKHRSAWCKWRRRLPHLIAVLNRMRDFYMEISFHFESSVIPFVGKIAPSDTYKIWKRGGDLRVDTSLAGFDGFKILKANQSFLFLSDHGDEFLDASPGTLLVLNRDDKTILNAFENAKDPISDKEVSAFCDQSIFYRPGLDVTKAKLVEMKNWRKQEKIETIGKWKAKAYEIENVCFSFKSRKLTSLPLDESHQSFSESLRELPSSSSRRRRSVSFPEGAVPVGYTVAEVKEKKFVKNLKPSVWLTDQFPLKVEELLPLLDVLADHVKAFRRMREMLTTKFLPGTFPVKLSIPVIPTVKVVITFTKFVPLQPLDQFYTPFSSPTLLSDPIEDQHDDEKSDRKISTSRRFSSLSWLRNVTGKSSRHRLKQDEQMVDPFTIPEGYKWISSNSDSSGKKITRSCGCARVNIPKK